MLVRVLAVALFSAAILLSQGSRGSIRGTVTDATEAIVPGSKVTLTNVQTGVQLTAESDALGNYLFDFLAAGTYRIEVELAGFKKVTRDNIVLEVARHLRVDLILEPGQVTETISVEARTALVETETGQLSTTVENRQVVSLPLVGRNPQEYRLLVPGVVNTPNGPITQGGLVRKDPYYIDGVNSSNHVWGGNPANPNPDVIQEFKVLTNSFTAEFGETSGGIMTSITKSGTNEIHGTLFQFMRNDKFNASNFFSHVRPSLRRNQFGGTVGGPIIKNRTFYFFNIQFTEQRGTATFTNITVPLPAFKQGDFSRILGEQLGTDALGRPVRRNQIFDPLSTRTVQNAAGANVVIRDAFPNNTIPASRFSPAAVKIQDFYPAPQIDTPFANYNSLGPIKNSNYEWDLKIDHNFSDNDKISTRYSQRLFNTDQPTAFGRIAGGQAPGTLGPGFSRNPGRQAVVNWVHLFGPRATNNLNLGWFQVYPKRTTPGYGVINNHDLGIFGMPNGGDRLGTPYMNFLNYQQLGATTDTLFFELQNANSLHNTMSMVFGRHNLKVGGEIRRLRTDNLQPGPMNTSWLFNTFYTDQRGFANTGFDYAGFLLGLPATMNYSIYPDYFRSRGSVYALFVQDDIRVSRKLTLNLGLRWDAPLWYREAQNRSGVFNLDRGEYQLFGQDGFRVTPWENNWLNWGPRFGFAYTPRGDSRLVVRGGYGVFVVGLHSSGANGFLLTNPIFADNDVGRYNTIDQINWRTTLDLIPYEPADKTGRNATAVSVYPDNNPMSLFQQWNLNVQNEWHGIMVELGYSGSRGSNLHYGAYNMNAIPVARASEAQGRFVAPYVPFPRFPNGVTSQSWIGSSSYNSFQMKIERRFAQGLGFLASYTWSKLIDVGQLGYRDPVGNRNLDRGLAPDNAPHRFVTGYSYELPFGRGRRWATSTGPLDYVIGGWELNGITTFQSGFTLSPTTTVNTCVCGNNLTRPNVTGSPHLSGSERTLNRWFDTSVFSLPAQYTIGNAGRGLIQGPGVINFDVNIAKRFRLPWREGMHIEYRAEFYNFFNTPQFADPNTVTGTANFGRITGSRNERQGQMALKLYF
jgi:hypothetical protein